MHDISSCVIFGRVPGLIILSFDPQIANSLSLPQQDIPKRSQFHRDDRGVKLHTGGIWGFGKNKKCMIHER
jgi:hypothetical protein